MFQGVVHLVLNVCFHSGRGRPQEPPQKPAHASIGAPDTGCWSNLSSAVPRSAKSRLPQVPISKPYVAAISIPTTSKKPMLTSVARTVAVPTQRLPLGPRLIRVDLQGPDINILSEVATASMPIINEAVPGAQVRPIPGLAIAEPELQLVPNGRRITAAGLDRSTVANIVRAVTSGTFVSEYFDGNDRLDIILKGSTWSSPEELASTPIATSCRPTSAYNIAAPQTGSKMLSRRWHSISQPLPLYCS